MLDKMVDMSSKLEKIGLKNKAWHTGAPFAEELGILKEWLKPNINKVECKKVESAMQDAVKVTICEHACFMLCI